MKVVWHIRFLFVFPLEFLLIISVSSFFDVEIIEGLVLFTHHYFISISYDNNNLSCRSTYLYDTLRPKLIHETNIDFLCELVDILKVEVLGEQVNRRGESLAGLRPTLQRILADVHERLTFRARTHIRDEVIFILEKLFLLSL